MTDQDIVDLYWQRSEQAIPETEAVYGAYLPCTVMRTAASTPRAMWS